MTSPIRIVIADDHPTLAAGLRGLLEIEPNLNVIGQAGNVTDVVDRVLSLKPDVLLLDLRGDGGSGRRLLPLAHLCSLEFSRPTRWNPVLPMRASLKA